jgi:hypothetical protein
LEELEAELAQLNEEAAALNDQLHNLNNRQQKLAELEREAEIVLSLYAGRLAAFDRITPEERRDVYGRLGLEVTISPGGIAHIEGNLAANFVPLQNQKSTSRRRMEITVDRCYGWKCGCEPCGGVKPP